MAKFTDRFDREWVLDISAHEIKEVRKALDINLFDAFANDYAIYSSVVAEVEKLVAVAWVLCRSQAQERGVSDIEFGRGMAGDALRALGDAFTEALIDFFPNARAREAVRATLQKGRELMELRTALLTEAVNALDAGLLLAKPSPGSTSSPESPASTPST